MVTQRHFNEESVVILIDLRNRRDGMSCKPHGEASGLVRSQRNLGENIGKSLYSGFP